MKNIKKAFLLVYLLMTGTIFAQSVSTIPSNVGNDRFATEYFTSVIRPSLSLNSFDNGGNDSKGLGLKQVLNEAFSGNEYIKDKLNVIFNDADNSLQTNSPTRNHIKENSRILQYTAFEALASYVLEQNNIDSVMSRSQGLNIRSHAVAVADLRQD